MSAAALTRRLATLLLLLVAACAPPVSHDAAKRSAAMVLLDHATHVEYGRGFGEESIAYDVAPPPPLDAARSALDAALRSAGWTPSLAETPRRYVETRDGRRAGVEYWRGAWKHADESVEYVLERRGDRLHVWASRRSTAEKGAPAAAAAPPPNPPEPALPASIEAAATDVVVLCGDGGVTALQARLTGASSAIVRWRHRDASGRETSGSADVAERPGRAPHEIDASRTRVDAGPDAIVWAPGTLQMTGSASEPKTLVSGTSQLQFRSSLRASKVAGAALRAVRLEGLCR